MRIRLKIRNYHLSPKLQTKYGVLLVGSLIPSFIITFAILMCLLHLGNPIEGTTAQITILVAVPFLVIKFFLEKFTDREYEVIIEEYNQKLANLTPENPCEIREENLTYPAKVKFTRVKANAGKLVKETYYINDQKYVLKNGESIDIITNKAVNNIEIRNKFAPDMKQFTVSENENIEIQYRSGEFYDIIREKRI